MTEFCLGETRKEETVYPLLIQSIRQVYLVQPTYKVEIDCGEEYKLKNGSERLLLLKAGVHRVGVSRSFQKTVVEVDMKGKITLAVSWNRWTGAIEIKKIQ